MADRYRRRPASYAGYYQAGSAAWDVYYDPEDALEQYVGGYPEEYEDFEEEHAAEPSPQQLRREREKRRIQRKVQKNREKAMHMSLPYVMMLTVATILTVLVCCQALRLKSDIAASRRNIQKLQTSVMKLKTTNDAVEDSIRIYTDLDYIYKVATRKLGMTYPAEDQVIRFDRTESEYVRQYEDIPTSD